MANQITKPWRLFAIIPETDSWRSVHIYNGQTAWIRQWHPKHGWDPTEEWTLAKGGHPPSLPPDIESLPDPSTAVAAMSAKDYIEIGNIVESLQAQNLALASKNKKLVMLLFLFFIISLPFLIK